MSPHRPAMLSPRVCKTAMSLSAIALASSSLALGVGVACDPTLRADFARDGHGSGFLLFLVVAHAAGAIGLLIPRLSGLAATLLGLMMAAILCELWAGGVNGPIAGPAALASAFLLFAFWTRQHHQATMSAWGRALLRYADGLDARGSGTA